MGCAGSRVHHDETSVAVEKTLAAAREKELYYVKMLLLGAGEAGKSTVVKQVKYIFKNGITEAEIEENRKAIRRNTIESMQAIIGAMPTFDITFDNDQSKKHAEFVLAQDTLSELTQEVATAILELWKDPKIQETFSMRDKFWVLDGAEYYFREIDRFVEEDYVPTEEDMLMSRCRTTGIIVTEFKEDPYTYHVVDVGGQRSERRKWLHCFDDVKAVIFLVGLSGYHQVLFEDNNKNRLMEDLDLFREVVRNPLFRMTPIFVFLNKKDLFEKMIAQYPLKDLFPEYDGPAGEMQPALDFIEAKFRKILEDEVPHKKMHAYVIAARVRMDMKIAFAEVKQELQKYYPRK